MAESFLPTVTLSGVKLVVGPPLSPRMQRVLLGGGYEATEREMVEASLRPYDTVLELGAGIGLISTLAAKIVGEENVTAFEANPQMIPVIERTYRLNDEYPTLRHAILGDQLGEADFYLHSDFWISSTVPSLDKTRVRVPMLRAQDVLEQVHPTTLICDIEGGEADLFKNFDLGSRLKKIILEVHPAVIGDTAVERLFAYFYAQGFTLISEQGQVWLLART